MAWRCQEGGCQWPRLVPIVVVELSKVVAAGGGSRFGFAISLEEISAWQGMRKAKAGTFCADSAGALLGHWRLDLALAIGTGRRRSCVVSPTREQEEELHCVPNAGAGAGVAFCPQRGSRRREAWTRLVLHAVGSGVGGGLVVDREGAVAGLAVENQSGGGRGGGRGGLVGGVTR